MVSENDGVPVSVKAVACASGDTWTVDPTAWRVKVRFFSQGRLA